MGKNISKVKMPSKAPTFNKLKKELIFNLEILNKIFNEKHEHSILERDTTTNVLKIRTIKKIQETLQLKVIETKFCYMLTGKTFPRPCKILKSDMNTVSVNEDGEITRATYIESFGRLFKISGIYFEKYLYKYKFSLIFLKIT